MSSKKTDYSIFDKFNFERKPVGVKYSIEQTGGIKPTTKSLALCELFKEAQTSQPFYVTKENVQCGEQVLGMVDYPPIMYSGQLGPMFAMFKNPGANRRIYDYVPHLPKDSVKYITHASIDQMTFEPDFLIFTANPTQAEIILRASSFSDGKMWNAKGDHLPGLRLDIRPSLSERRNELHRQRPRLQHESPGRSARRPDYHHLPLRCHLLTDG